MTQSLQHKHELSLIPSLPATSFEEIEKLLYTLKKTAYGVQIDIVDGVFAPYTSWPFTESDVLESLQQLSVFAQDFEIEIDCMCMNPLQYLDTFVNLGAKRVVIHVGTTENIDACISHATENGYTIGLAVRNDTSSDILASYHHLINFVQVMGIANIGVQGQAFEQQTLVTIASIRELYPDLEIAVDGAVNETTILNLLHAGATRFAPGSAITKAEDPRFAYTQLQHLIDL